MCFEINELKVAILFNRNNFSFKKQYTFLSVFSKVKRIIVVDQSIRIPEEYLSVQNVTATLPDVHKYSIELSLKILETVFDQGVPFVTSRQENNRPGINMHSKNCIGHPWFEGDQIKNWFTCMDFSPASSCSAFCVVEKIYLLRILGPDFT